LIVIAVALARGGSLRNFATLELRWLPLVLGGFGLQLLIFTPFRDTPLIPFATAPLYLLSMARRVTQLLAHLAHPARAVAEAGAGPRDGSFAEGPGAAEGARAHARAVGEQGAVDGIVHVRFDHGAVAAQRAATGAVVLPGQGHHIKEARTGLPVG
jgi:hypothetical protein